MSRDKLISQGYVKDKMTAGLRKCSIFYIYKLCIAELQCDIRYLCHT